MPEIINTGLGMRFGAGVDRDTQEARAVAIEFDGIETRSGGQRADAGLRMVESQESLVEALNLTVGVSARYGIANGDIKFALATQKEVSKYSLFVLMTAYARNPPQIMVNPRLKPDVKIAYTTDPEMFYSIYGDTYIDEIHTGGDFYGLFSFETFNERNHSELKASLNAAVNTFLLGGNLDAALSMIVDEAKSKSAVSIRAIRAGGSAVENPTNLDELKTIYKNFAALVKSDPIDYQVSIKDFKYLPLPAGPTWGEKELRQSTIRTCDEYIMDGIRSRNDIGFVLRYPGQFEDFDREKLEADLEKVEDLLPRIAQQSRDCAGDLSKCSVAGIVPIAVTLPKRITRGDPLETKLEDVLLHDSRAAGYFQTNSRRQPLTGADDGPDGGRFIRFFNGDTPWSGVFWHPKKGVHVVYGGIFAAYQAQGHCEGPLGYPTSDEMTISRGMTRWADGLDRISFFEDGRLWWDAQTQQVSNSILLNIDVIRRQINA